MRPSGHTESNLIPLLETWREVPLPVSSEEYEASHPGWSHLPCRTGYPTCKSMYSNSPPSLIRVVAFPGLFGPAISSADVAPQVCSGLTSEVPKVSFQYGHLFLYRSIR